MPVISGPPAVKCSGRACIFFVLGILIIAAAIIIFGIYFTVIQITSSTSHTEVLPTYIIAACLSSSGILVLLLFWKRWKPLVICSLLTTVISSLLCVETVILTGTHVIQPMLYMSPCKSVPPSTCVCHSKFKRAVLYLEYLETDTAIYTYEDASNCAEITTTLLHLVYGLTFMYVIAFVLCVLSSALIGVVLRLQKVKLTNQCRYDDVFSVEGSILSFPSDVDETRHVTTSDQSAQTSSRAVENEYAPMNKVQRSHSLAAEGRECAGDGDEALSATKNDPQESGSNHGWGDHKRDTKKRTQRAVTLHNLDTRELMLILNLQMRYLKENGLAPFNINAGTSQKVNAQNELDDSQSCDDTRQRNLFGNLSGEQMENLLQKCAKNLHQNYDPESLNSRTEIHKPGLDPKFALNVGEDLHASDMQQRLNNLNRSKTPGPQKTSRHKENTPAAQRMMNIRDCKSTPPVRGHPYDDVDFFKTDAVNAKYPPDKGDVFRFGERQYGAESGNTFEKLRQYGTDADIESNEWYCRKETGEICGNLAQHVLDNKRMRGKLKQCGSLKYEDCGKVGCYGPAATTGVNYCSCDDSISESCYSNTSQRSAFDSSDTLLESRNENMNQHSATNGKVTDKFNAVKDMHIPAEYYKPPPYGKTPASRADNGRRRQNSTGGRKVEPKKCIDQYRGSGDESFENMKRSVRRGSNPDNEKDYVLIRRSHNADIKPGKTNELVNDCRVSPHFSKFAAPDCDTSRGSVGASCGNERDTRYPPNAGGEDVHVGSPDRSVLRSNYDYGTNLLESFDKRTKSPVVSHETNAHPQTPGSHNRSGVQSPHEVNTADGRAKSTSKGRSKVQIRTNPYTAFLPYNKRTSRSHNDVRDRSPSPADPRDMGGASRAEWGTDSLGRNTRTRAEWGTDSLGRNTRTYHVSPRTNATVSRSSSFNGPIMSKSDWWRDGSLENLRREDNDRMTASSASMNDDIGASWSHGCDPSRRDDCTWNQRIDNGAIDSRLPRRQNMDFGVSNDGRNLLFKDGVLYAQVSSEAPPKKPPRCPPIGQQVVPPGVHPAANNEMTTSQYRAHAARSPVVNQPHTYNSPQSDPRVVSPPKPPYSVSNGYVTEYHPRISKEIHNLSTLPPESPSRKSRTHRNERNKAPKRGNLLDKTPGDHSPASPWVRMSSVQMGSSPPASFAKVVDPGSPRYGETVLVMNSDEDGETLETVI